MARYGIDVEADGLPEAQPAKGKKPAIPKYTKLHSLVIRNIDTRELVLSCADQPGYKSIKQGVKFLLGLPLEDEIWAFNGIRTDFRMLDEQYPEFKTGFKDRKRRARDAMVICQYIRNNAKVADAVLVTKKRMPAVHKGKHTLAAWGYRLGVHKGEYSGGFERWNEEMQKYCEIDTDVLAVIVQYLDKSIARPLATEIELELAWFLHTQQQNGWPINMDKATLLYTELVKQRTELTERVRQEFKPWYVPVKKYGEVVVKTAACRRKVVLKGTSGIELVTELEKGVQYTDLKLMTFNPGSRQQVADRLTKLYGWQPTKFTDSGQPKVDEEQLSLLDPNIGPIKALIDYFMVAKRIGQVAGGDKAWLKFATPNMPHGGKITGLHHIHHQVLQEGTITHRAAHMAPNMGQVPDAGEDTPYGWECRELFHVPGNGKMNAVFGRNAKGERIITDWTGPGTIRPVWEDHPKKGRIVTDWLGDKLAWGECGVDMSGIEARLLAHYMSPWDKGEYIRVVTEGDIHSVNRDALGLEGVEGRKQAKLWFYAFCYGAGDTKLGVMVPPTPAEVEKYKANKRLWAKTVEKLRRKKYPTDDWTVSVTIHGGVLRARFLKGLPAMAKLLEAVKAKADTQKYLTLPDGRRVFIRHGHAALNSLLQGAGAICAKLWMVLYARELEAQFGPASWSGNWSPMGWIHDENQTAARMGIIKDVAEIKVRTIKQAGEMLNITCPLTGEAKFGPNWAATH